MSSPAGYIKLHRKVLESGILKNHKLWAFWSWCLLKASHRDYEQVVGCQVVCLSPGQFLFGRKAASKELKMSEQEIRTCLNFCLKVDRNLTIKTTNKFSIITLINWDTYQGRDDDSNQQDNQQLTNKEPTTNQQLTTNKNGKNIKNEKKEDIGSDAQFWTELRSLYTWVDFEKEIAKMKAYQLTPRGRKWTMTKRSVVNWLNKVDRPVAYMPQTEEQGESYAERRLRERAQGII